MEVVKWLIPMENGESVLVSTGKKLDSETASSTLNFPST